MTKITVDNNGEPDTPATGRTVIYANATTKVLNSKDDAGTVRAYGDTKQLKISSDDTTEGYLEDKLIAGSGVTVTVNNSGANETITVASTAAGAMTYEGGYNASTNTPDLDTSPSGILAGEMYTVTAAGTFFTEDVIAGDALISNTANPTLLSDWTVLQDNLTPASIKTKYESNANTNELNDLNKAAIDIIDLDGTFTDYNMRIDTGAGAASLSTGTNNIGIGNGAYGSTSTGNDNIAIGSDTLSQTTANAGNNIAIGKGALNVTLTSAAGNAVIGVNALSSASGGSANSYNSAIGYQAGRSCISAYNVFAGYNAGSILTTGSKNIVIGQGAQPSSNVVHNECTMGDTNMNNFRVPGIGLAIGADKMTYAGTYQQKITTVTANTTLGVHNTVIVDTTSGAITITLPAATSNTGTVYNIKKKTSDVNAITVDANASETIDGALTQTISLQYDSMSIHCDGTTWWII